MPAETLGNFACSSCRYVCVLCNRHGIYLWTALNFRAL